MAKIEQLKEYCYQLLGQKKYDSLQIVLNQGKSIAQSAGLEAEVLNLSIFEAETHFMLDDFGKCISLYKKVIENSDENHNEYNNFFLKIAFCYTRIPNIDSAFHYANIALEQCGETDRFQKLIVYRTIADIHQNAGKFVEAINFNIKSLSDIDAIAKDEGINEVKAKWHSHTSYAGLGDLFFLLKDYDSALHYFDKAIALGLEINLNTAVTLIYLQKGDIYVEKNQLDSAKHYYHLVQQRQDEETASNRNLFFAYHRLALVYTRDHQLVKAREYLTKMDDYFSQIETSVIRNNYYMVYGEYHLINGEPSKSLKYLNQYEAIETDEIKIDLYNLKQKALFQIGQSERAYAYLEKYHQIKDSIFTLQNNEIIYNLEAKYNRVEQDLAITKLDLENKKNEVTLAQKNKTILLGGLGLLFLALLGGLSFRLYRTKRKAAQELTEKNALISKSLSEKELLLKEIHHRVKNNLQVISSLLSLQTEYIKDDSALEALNEGRDRVKSMALIHQNLYQGENLTAIQIKKYFQKLTDSLFNSYNISPDRIQLKMSIEEMQLDVDTIIPLGLIVNELLSNALKYAFKGLEKGIVEVVLKESNGQLHLGVYDNGIGFDTQTINEDTPSFGYQMIFAFKEKLEADLNIDGSQGTKVDMYIHDYQKVS